MQRLAFRAVLCTAILGLAGVVAAPLRAQPTPVFKDAPSNPCQFDAGLGRNARCATAGQTVTFSFTSFNGTGSDQVVTVRDTQPTPAGCFTFVCPPLFLIDGMPEPLPAGSTCDPAGGFVLPDYFWRSGASMEVRFDAQLSAALPALATCSNQAAIQYTFGTMDSADSDPNCRVDWPGPTELAICQGSTPQPDFHMVKTAETPAGGPIPEIHDGDAICWRIHVENRGTAPGGFFLSDIFPDEVVGLAIDPAVQFDTGSCSITGQQLSCANVALAGGGQDDVRVCGVHQCNPSITVLQNAATLVVTEPPGGPTVSSRPCDGCPPGPAEVPVVTPDLSPSALQATLEDQNGNNCADAGDRVRYVATLSNASSAPATNVEFRGPDPPGSAYAGNCEYSTGGGPFAPCPASPTTGFVVGNLLQGAPPAVIRWSVDLLNPDPAQPFCNADARVLVPECSAGRGLGIACVDVCPPGPLLEITKVSDPLADAEVGQTVTYGLHVCNRGGAPAVDATITDPIPACLEYVPGSLRLRVPPGSFQPLTDGADGDGGEYRAQSPAAVVFSLQIFLGGPLEAGECVDARFDVRVAGCGGQIVPNTATVVASGTSTFPSNEWLLGILVPHPRPSVTKTVSPTGTVQPGATLTYGLTVCNDASANADLLNGVLDDWMGDPCITYLPGSLKLDGQARTDATDGDGAEFEDNPDPELDRPVFHLRTLVPGECQGAEFQVTVHLDCEGRTITNSASLTADNSGLTGSNTVQNPVAGVEFTKTATDLNGDPLFGDDGVRYEILLCNRGTTTFLDVHLEDAIPGTSTPAPASDCETTYVPGSMFFSVYGNPLSPLTDAPGDDVGRYVAGPPARVEIDLPFLAPDICLRFLYRVVSGRSCDPGECVRNTARATYDQSGPIEKFSNTATLCAGTPGNGQPWRNVGRASLTATGGCESGDRLSQFACSALPGLCRPEIPGQKWTMIGDAAPSGEPITFYEVHGDGCCAAAPSDGNFLRVRKEPGSNDLVLELDWRCP